MSSLYLLFWKIQMSGLVVARSSVSRRDKHEDEADKIEINIMWNEIT